MSKPEVWYQAEFYSKLDNCWVPLGGRAATEDAAWQAYSSLTGLRRIVKVTRTFEVVVIKR